MKKIILIICLLPIFAFSQVSYKIIADSTILKSISTNSNELVIRNSTKDTTTSVLYNNGNGVTQFKKVRSIKLNDSTYVIKIGTSVIGDTIKIKSTGNIGGTDTIYYTRTFAHAKAEMAAHTLKRGAKYMLSDFTTIYDQPDFHANGTPKDTVVTKTASVEHLVFTANSDSTFDNYVSSIEYPTDILNFDWTFTATEVMGAPAKGRISFREDVESANSAFYDFRKVLYLRYESSPGSGVFNSIKDNGGASQEFLTFNAPSVGTKIGIFGALGVQITGIPFYLNNVVFENSAINASVDGVVFNVTFVDITAGVKVGYGSSDILFNGGSAYTYIRVGNNVIFNGQCNFNSLWGLLINITTGDNFNHNIQYDSWTNSTVGNNFTQGILYGLIDSLTAGDDNFKIDIKNGKAITIGDGNSGISFSGTSHILPLNDFNGIKNVSFSGGIDAYGWINGITTSTHPEMYLNLTKTIFIGGNGTDNTQDNVYSRYFNNTTDVITIIN